MRRRNLIANQGSEYEIDGYSIVENNTILNATSPFRFTNDKGQEYTFAPTTPLILRGVNAIKDTWRNTGKLSIKIGNVADLSGLNYRYDDTYRLFHLLTNIGAKLPSTQIVLGNVLSNIYQTQSQAYVAGHIDKDMCVCSLNWGNGVSFRNLSYNDATSFKTAMQGVPLDYELATYIQSRTQSFKLPKNITHCFDSRGVELTIRKIK